MKKILLPLVIVFFAYNQAISQAGIGVESGSSPCGSHTTAPPTPSCSFQSFTLGAGAYTDITVTNGVVYEFYASYGTNASTTLSGVHNTSNTLQKAITSTSSSTPDSWTANSTTMRLSTNRTGSTWSCTSSTINYRIATPTSVSASVSPTSICADNSTTTSLTGGGTNVTTWAWSNAGIAGTYTASSGAQSPTFKTSNAGSGVFTLNASNGGCAASAVNTASSLTTKSTSAATAGALTQPSQICGTAATTVSIGSTTNASAPTNANLSIAWYYTPPSGSATLLSGQTGQTLSSAALNLNTVGNWLFERRATTDCNGTASTASITLKVVDASAATAGALTQPSNVCGTAATTVSIASTTNAAASGNATLSIAWYYTPPSGSATLLSGQTGQTLSSAALNLNTVGNWLFERRATTDCNGTVATASITLKVVDATAATAGALTQPSNICGTAATTVSIASTTNAAASGNATLNIAWYYTPPSGSATLLSGQTGQTLSSAALNLNTVGNWLFERRATTDCNGAVATASITLKVVDATAATAGALTQPSNICGTAATTVSIASTTNAAASGNATLSIAWYYTPPSGSATLLAGQNGQALSSAALNLNTIGNWLFERRATTDCNGTVATASITLKVVDATAATAGALTQPSAICGTAATTVSIGSTTNAAASGNATLNIAWYYTPPSGSATLLTGQNGQTLSSASLALNTTGNWVFERRATTDCNGTVATASITLTVDPTVSITNAPTGGALCESNTSFTFTNSLAGGTWGSSNTGVFTIGSGTGTVTPVVITGSTQNASANVTYTRGSCSAAPVALRIDNAPTPAAGPDQTLCNSSSQSFTLAAIDPATGANAVTGSTGNWACTPSCAGGFSINAPTSQYNTSAGSISPGASQTLRWTVTNGQCSSSDDVILKVDQNFSIVNPSGTTGSGASSGTPVQMCDNTTTYTWTVTPAVTVTWSNTGTGSINSSTGDYTTTNLSPPTQNATGTITAQNGTCSVSKFGLVSNYPSTSSGTPSPAYDFSAMCGGSTRTLNSDVNGSVFTLNGLSCGPCTVTTGNTFTGPSQTAASSPYSVVLTNGGCTNSSIPNLTVERSPTIDVPSPTAAVCEGTITTLHETHSPAASVQWSVDMGSLSSSSGTTSNYTAPTIASASQQNTTATFTISSASGGCVLTTQLRIDNQNNIISPSANPTPVCDASTISLDGDVDGVTWTSALGGFGATSPGQDPTFTPTALTSGTSATGTIVATNGACTPRTLNIRVDRNPVISNVPARVCDASTFTANSNISVTWNSAVNGTLGSSTGSSSVFTPTAISGSTVNQPGSFNAVNGNCTVPESFTIDNNPAIVTPASPACDNSNPDFNLSDLAESSVVWSADYGTITNTGTRGVLTYDVPDPTASQIVTVTATNNSCAPTTTIQLDNNPTATPNAGPDQTYPAVCGTKLTTLAGSTPAVSGSGTWTQISGPSGSNTTFSPNSHTPGAGTNASAYGTYVYQWQVASGSCPAVSDQVTVIYDLPLSRVPVEDDCMSMSQITTSTSGNLNYAYFVVTASGGTGPGTYTFPADNLPYLKKVGTIDPSTCIYEFEVNYSDNLTVTDNVGCTAGAGAVAPSVHTAAPIDIAHSVWINGSSTALSTGTCYNNGIDRWVTFCDNAGGSGSMDAIMAIDAHDNDLGLVSVSMYRNDDEPVVINSTWNTYDCTGVELRPMERHFAVTTTNQPNKGQSNGPGLWNGSGSVGVRLFFTNQELKDIIAETYGTAGTGTIPGTSNMGNGCLANDDVTDITKLYVTKYTAPPGYLATENGDYSDNIPSAGPLANPNAIYRLFGDNVTLPGNGPLRKDHFNNPPTNTAINFDGIYGRVTPNDINGVPQPHHFVEMDVAEFSEFWLHGTAQLEALPVQMIYLEANPVNNAYIQLKWATAIEVNNAGFRVERSVDGQTWTQIGWVNGQNNSTTQTNYSFDDVNVVPGIPYYYRLNQVDNDGASQYTNVVSARIIGDISFSVKEFVPNPTNDKTNLIITATKDQDITITFYDVIGQKVLESNHQINKGGNMLTFELGSLASGTYTAVVSSANEIYTKKVVLAR